MACEDKSKRNCFTFLWKLENVNNWWFCDYLQSPVFTVEEIDNANWKMLLEFSRYGDTELIVDIESVGDGNIELDYELAFLSCEDTVLHSFEGKYANIDMDQRIEAEDFPSWNEVFFARRSVYIWENTLTVRCRVWKSVGEFSMYRQLCARTRQDIKKMSFQWDIENFSTLKSDDKQTYEKSIGVGELFILELFTTAGLICDERVCLKIIPDFKNIRAYILQISIVDASKNTLKCYEKLFTAFDLYDTEFTLCYTKKDLIERKSSYLPNDVLSLLFQCSFCFETSAIENESDSSNCAVTECKEMSSCWLDIENLLIVPKMDLIDDLKSMLNNNTLSDVKLRTKTKTHPAHKCILSSRSPVFAAMFSNDTREKITDCVDIEDLEDDAVARMLQYVYSADVKDLEWVSATGLYEAADKYQILTLKDICSSYIKTNLCPRNACDALVLADLHQDEDLKLFVQNFILRRGRRIMSSEEWELLMKNNPNLAAETEHRMCEK